jgi:cell division inhibitor SepF
VAKILDKFIGLMGFGDDDTDGDYSSEQIRDEYSEKGEKSFQVLNSGDSSVRNPKFKESYVRESVRESSSKRKQAPVVSIHTQKQVRVMLVEPVSFEEAQGIAEHLKARKSVILNLERTDPDLSQRLVDFVSGTTYALGGNMQKVGNGIFLFVPNNVDISGEFAYRNTERDFTWSKTNK